MTVSFCVLLCILIIGGVAADEPRTARDLTLVVVSRGTHYGHLRNALRAISADDPSETTQVIVAPVSSSAPASATAATADALEAAVESALPRATILPPRKSVAAALNSAVNSSGGRYIAVVDDSVEVSRGFISAVVRSLSQSSGSASPLTALLGCVLMSEDGITVHHIGVDFATAKLVKSPQRYYFGTTEEQNQDQQQQQQQQQQQKLPDIVPVPIYVLQGHSRRHPTVDATVKSGEAFTVSADCAALSRATYLSIGAFDEEISDRFFMADYSLRVREKAGAVVALCGDCKGTHLEGDGASELDDDYEYRESEMRPFLKKWLAPLQERIVRNRDKELANVTVSWSMECGSGQTLGFTTEAVNFVLALQDAVSLRVEVKNRKQCLDELRKAGWPRSTIGMIARLSSVDPEYKDNVVLVVHRDPGRYRSFINDRWGEQAPARVVGRSMFETDSVPSDWVANCNGGLVQRIWVPSDFNVGTFAKAGVNSSLLSVLPEPIDTALYSPGTYDPLPIDALGPATGGRTKTVKKSDTFVFLAVSKWEPRKGLDKLIAAFLEEFSSADDVALVIRSNVDDKNAKEFDSIVANATASKLSMGSASSVPSRKPALISGLVPLWKMPSLYAAADCFALPTRGEGWGLPIVEAMSMGVPVIATNWSGCTAYLRDDNAFLLTADGLTDVPNHPGHKWASPSTGNLRALMRKVFSGRQDAKLRAERARSFVVSHVSLAVVREITVAKLREVMRLPKYEMPAYQAPTYNAPASYYTATSSRPTRIKINP